MVQAELDAQVFISVDESVIQDELKKKKKKKKKKEKIDKEHFNQCYVTLRPELCCYLSSTVKQHCYKILHFNLSSIFK